MINYYCPCNGLPLYKIDIRQNGNTQGSNQTESSQRKASGFSLPEKEILYLK